MKNLLVLLFLFSTACFSQYTKEVKTFPVVEKAVFESINKYREEKGLKKVIWCGKAYQAAYHHSYYLSDMKKIPKILHEETVDVEDFEELVYLGDRLRKYVSHGGSPYGVENIITNNFNDWWFQRKDLDPIQNYCRCIFGSWKDSPGHNESMLDKRVTHGAIAIVRELDSSYCRVVMVFYKY
jgi:uncharacterized protein YkwD